MLISLPKKKKKIFFISNAFSAKQKAITPASIPKRRGQKIYIDFVTFMLVTIARDKSGKNGEYLETNIILVLYI